MTVDLVIAGRLIRLCSREGVSLLPDERFRSFTLQQVKGPGTGAVCDTEFFVADTGEVAARTDSGPFAVESRDPSAPVFGDKCAGQEPDLFVEVETGPGEIPASALKVFDAQLMVEVPGGVRNTGEPFWDIFAGEEAIYARVYLQDNERIPLLVMPRGTKRWQIFAGGDGQGQSHRGDSTLTVNPLPYPLDGLLLYFLFSQTGDIMIHGSGVVSGGRGWIFTGRSGSGKTTMARIFDGAGDRVIHDDRLVLRREGSGWVMHNSPVYRNDEPRSAPLDHLWVIRHGSSNVSEPVAGAEAVAMILANCIQQNWDREAASRLAAAADDLSATVRVSRLSFLPDDSIRDYLILRANADKILAAGAVLSMLDEGRSVTVTAGGYSMWPAIRPGDTVVIDPIGTRLPEIGEIVALKRDGGYVIHRVTGVTAGRDATIIRTQGDSVTREDEPADAGMIAGVVGSVVRSGRQQQPPPRYLPRWMNRITAAVAGWVRG